MLHYSVLAVAVSVCVGKLSIVFSLLLLHVAAAVGSFFGLFFLLSFVICDALSLIRVLSGTTATARTAVAGTKIHGHQQKH